MRYSVCDIIAPLLIYALVMYSLSGPRDIRGTLNAVYGWKCYSHKLCTEEISAHGKCEQFVSYSEMATACPVGDIMVEYIRLKSKDRHSCKKREYQRDHYPGFWHTYEERMRVQRIEAFDEIYGDTILFYVRLFFTGFACYVVAKEMFK
jgi:hypothetical protein